MAMATNVPTQTVADAVQNGHPRPPTEKTADLLGLVENGSEDQISEDGLRVSEAVYWEKYYDHPDFNYEWNDGVLEEKPVSHYSQYTVYEWLVALLYEYLRVRPIARKMALEMGFRLALPDKTTIRKPDLFVVRNDNPIALGDIDRTYAGICDLCIELISDSTKRAVERDTVHKKNEYAVIGVREYFILDPSGKHMAFYRRSVTGAYVDIDAGGEGIIRSEVLPGFQFRIADLDRKPSWIELVDDEVYRGFLLLDFQAEKARADYEHTLVEQERTRAEQERTRAEQEHLRAEQEQARAEQAHLIAEQERMRAEQAHLIAEQERMRAEQAHLIAEQERSRAEQEHLIAEQERSRAEQEQARAERLAAKLRALGIEEEG